MFLLCSELFVALTLLKVEDKALILPMKPCTTPTTLPSPSLTPSSPPPSSHMGLALLLEHPKLAAPQGLCTGHSSAWMFSPGF